ncbi:MAG: adenylate/guanylate cyclase domain-containing protein [Gammaproteobacteria bacterium]
MPETYYDAPKAPGADVSDKQARYTRVLAFLVVAATLATGIAARKYGGYQGLLIPLFIAYPPLAHRLAEFLLSRAHPAPRVNAMLFIADAIMLGIAIAAMQFAVVPSLMVLMIVASNAMAIGGVQTFVMSLATTLFGCLAGILLLGFRFLPHADTPTLLTVVPVMGVLVYLAINSLFSQEQREILLQAQQEVRAQREQALALTRRLSKYLPPQVYGALFSGRREAKLETRRKKLTVFFSDVRGFTNLSDEIPLEQLTAVLNQYLNEMTRIALKHGGTIDKFMGDGIMIFFGDPVSKGSREDAVDCVSMAVEMQKQMQVLRQHWKERNINTPLEIRIGINTGVCTVGNFGAESRMDYTILGREVNLASRLESSTQPGTILISESTYQLVKDAFTCRSKGRISVKGIAEEIAAYEVVDFRRNLGGGTNSINVQRPGLTLMLDIDKVRNYEQPKVMDALVDAVKVLRTTATQSLDADATGFMLRLRNNEIDPDEREKITHLVDRCAKKLREKIV